jgi:signal transduction histidine kinase
MNERARLLGGELCLDSVPGEGTVVEVSVPAGAVAVHAESVP